jgi:hypothetical protein
MSQEQIRKDIDSLIAEIKEIKKEMALRFDLIKGDAFEGLKAAAVIAAALFGIRIAFKITLAILSFAFRHKLSLAIVSGLCYFGFRRLNASQTKEC